MEWINIFGLVFMTVIMIPNIIFAAKRKDGFENLWKNKTVETLEQIGRFCCFVSDEAFALYLIVDCALTLLYCAVWAICFKKDSMFKAVVLSVLPSAMFLFSGIMLRSVPLIVSALIFAPCHILISCKNAAAKKNKRSDTK